MDTNISICDAAKCQKHLCRSLGQRYIDAIIIFILQNSVNDMPIMGYVSHTVGHDRVEIRKYMYKLGEMSQGHNVTFKVGVRDAWKWWGGSLKAWKVTLTH